MAPTLNCNLGDLAANSYVCLDEAEQIAANIPGGDEWIALSEDEKVFSLIAATALLETLQYRGTVCANAQRLKWPREGLDCEGRPFDCTFIPYKIKEAEVMLAMQLAQAIDIIKRFTRLDLVNIQILQLFHFILLKIF